MARRLNVKFLAAGVIITASLAGGYYGYQKFFYKENPQKYIDRGQQCLAERKFDEAKQNFAVALRLRPSDPLLASRLADSCYYLGGDEANYRAAFTYWNRALDLDPNYLPAMRSLLAYHRDRLRTGRIVVSDTEKTFKDSEDIALRIMKVAPDDKNLVTEAKSVIAWSYVTQFIMGVSTDTTKAEEQILTLQELMKQHPENPDFPYCVMLARAELAKHYSSRDPNPAKAQQYFEEAAKTFDEPLRLQEKNPSMYLQAYQGLMHVSQGNSDSPETAKTLRNKAKQVIDLAREIVQPSDPLYSRVLIAWSEARLRNGDLDDAEQAMRELLNERKKDIEVRLQLEKILRYSPGKRDEAITVLEEIPANDSRDGLERITQERMQIDVANELATLRLESFFELPDVEQLKEKKQQLLTKINEHLEKIRLAEGATSNRYMRLLGRYQLAKKDAPASVKTFGVYFSNLQDSISQRDIEAKFWYSQSLVTANETGNAKDLLNEIIRLTPSYVPARTWMVKILLDEKNPTSTAEARTHIEYLVKIAPDAAIYRMWLLHTLDKDRDAARIEKVYQDLPESRPDQRWVKQDAAGFLGKMEERERILKLMVQEGPGKYEPVRELLGILVQQKKFAEATAIADAAIKASPSDNRLALLKQNIAYVQDPTAENKQAIVEKIEESKDPYTRKLGEAERALRNQKDPKNIETAIGLFKEADAINPKDKRAKERLFFLYRETRNFDAMDSLVKSLAEINADEAQGDLYRIQFMLARGDKDSLIKADDYCDRLMKNYPDFSEVYRLAGLVRQAEGMYDEAIKNFALAIKKRSQNKPAYDAMIQCHYIQQQYEDAMRIILSARDQFPDDPRYQEMEIIHQLRFGDPAKAVTAREAQLAERPDDIQAHLNLAAAYYMTGRTAAQKQDKAKSDALFAKAEATMKKCAAKWPDDLRVAGTLGDILLVEQKPQEALDVVSRAIGNSKWKEEPEALALLASVQERAGKANEAETSLRKACSRDPKRVDMQIALVELLVRSRKFDAALSALDANGGELAVQRKRCQVLIDAGKNDEAETSLRDAIAKNEKDADFRAILVDLLVRTAKLDKVGTEIQQLLAIDPGNPIARLARAKVNLVSDKPDLQAAMSDATAALEARPDMVEARVILSRIHQSTLNYDAAIRELEIAQAQVPLSRDLRLQLVRAYMTAVPKRNTDAVRLINESRVSAGMQNDPALYTLESQMWRDRGDMAKALDAATNALRNAQGDPSAVRNYLDMLMLTRNFPSVISETDTLLKKNRDIYWVYAYRAQAKAMNNDLPGAKAELMEGLAAADRTKNSSSATEIIDLMANIVGVDQAIAVVSPRVEKDNEWKLVLIALYDKKGDFVSSARLAEESLAHPESISESLALKLNYVLSRAYLSTDPRQPEKAEKAMLKILEKVPDDTRTLNNLAYVLLEMKSPSNPAEALKYAKLAYEAVQRARRFDPLVYDTYGWVLIANDRPGDGIDILRQVIERAPFAEAYYHLGEAYLRQKFASQAIESFKAADKANMKPGPKKDSPKEVDDQELKKKIDDAISRANKMLDDAQKEQAGIKQ